jgi:ABC-2 type transport system ATP-binding protein
MISVSSLSKRFDSTKALDNVSFEIPSGSVFGLLGPNGAGKTTLLRLVMGFLWPDSGTVNLGTLHPAQIGYLPERAFYPRQLTISSYLRTMGRLAGLKGSQVHTLTDELLQRVNLHNARNQRLGTCSRGMLQRLGLAQALLADPPILLLDEPARALDPAGQRFMRQQIAWLHQAGTTIVLSTHHLDEVTRICTHIAVLSKGKLVRLGLLDSMLAPRSQVIISVSPLPDNLAAQLASLAPTVSVADGQIVLSGESTNAKAKVLRTLLDHEVDIRNLTERHATLEEVYLEATVR